MGSKIHKPTGVVADTLPATAGGTADKHPADTTLFQQRYAELLRDGDPYTSPLLDPNPAMNGHAKATVHKPLTAAASV